MTTFSFIGSVVPPVIELAVDYVDGTWPRDDGGPSVRTRVRIAGFVVSVECETDAAYSENERDLGYQLALELAQTVVDFVSFKAKVPQAVFFDRFVGPDGVHTHLIPKFFDDPIAANFAFDGNELLEFSTFGPGFAAVVNDLVNAHTFKIRSPIAYGRVADGLRNLIVPIGTETKIGWVALQTALRVNEHYVRYITDRSVRPRHGERVVLGVNELRTLRDRSWELVNRFVEWKRNSGNLPDRFEPLTG